MIRPMEEKDLQEVNEIYNDAILNTTALYKVETETLEQRKEWFYQKRQQGDPMFVFEVDGKVAGFVTYSQFRPYIGYKYSVEHSVYVHKDFHRLGIGTKLMKYIIEVARNNQIKTMVGVIDSDNHGSIVAHEKLGFYFAGRLKDVGYKFGRWLSIVYYQLDLDGPGF